MLLRLTHSRQRSQNTDQGDFAQIVVVGLLTTLHSNSIDFRVRLALAEDGRICAQYFATKTVCGLGWVFVLYYCMCYFIVLFTFLLVYIRVVCMFKC